MLVITEQDVFALRRAQSPEFVAYLRSQAVQAAMDSLGLDGPALHRQQGKAQVLIELAELLTKVRSM